MKSLERLESRENEEHSGKVQFIRERYEENLIFILILRSVAKLGLETLNYDS